MTSAGLLLGVPLIAALLSLYPLLILLSPHTRAALPSEYHYLCIKADEKQSKSKDLDAADAEERAGKGKLPFLVDEDAATVQLTVVIPAYNEESRLPQMLTETVEYLESLRDAHVSLASATQPAVANGNGSAHSNGTANGKANGRAARTVSLEEALRQPLSSYEILIVDDGSRDRTVNVALELAEKLGLTQEKTKQLRVVKLEKNRGKGGAVRHGVLHSRGALILFADADGATRFSDLGELCAELDRVRTPTGHGVALGSRAHLVGSEAVVKRSFVRNFLMHSFHLFLSLLLRPPSPSRLLLAWQRRRAASGKPLSLPLAQPEIRDTQCGFKLFTRATAQHIFPLSHLDRWIFDVELLMLAELASERTLRCGAGAVQRSASATTSVTRTSSQKKHKRKNSKSSPAAAQRANGAANGSSSAREQEEEAVREVLLRLPVPIVEIPVHWAEVSGSKIELLKDSIGMALDLLILRANYGLGRWTRPGVVPVA